MPHNNGSPMQQITPEDVKQFLEQLGPAAIGTAVSMLFTDGRWKKRLAQGVVGVPFSMYMAPTVYAISQRWGWGEAVTSEGAGVLTAVFGLAIVSYVFEMWKQLHLGPMLREWLAKRLGVTNPEDKQP